VHLFERIMNLFNCITVTEISKYTVSLKCLRNQLDFVFLFINFLLIFHYFLFIFVLIVLFVLSL
jgi:hypothetical protein